MKYLKIYSLFLFVAFFGLVSCDETEEAGEYANWSVRNSEYIDSIATVARANESGDWVQEFKETKPNTAIVRLNNKTEIFFITLKFLG